MGIFHVVQGDTNIQAIRVNKKPYGTEFELEVTERIKDVLFSYFFIALFTKNWRENTTVPVSVSPPAPRLWSLNTLSHRENKHSLKK